MAYMAWDSPEIIAYSKDKEQTAYQFGYIIGSTLLAIMMAFVTKNAADILADKQLMGNLMGNAKLQFRGILSQRDCIALAVGNKGATTIQIGQVYTPAAVAVIEGSVSTAAEQGIILKAGKVLSAGYPAGKIGADTAEKICDEVKDGETDAEEIAEEVDKNDISNIDIDEMFTDDAIGHLEEVKKYTRKGGIRSAHTVESFERATKEIRPAEILSKEKLCDGIYHIEYKVAKMEKGKPVIKPDGTYELRSTIYEKSIIDTAEMGIDDVVSMAKEAFASGKISFTENGQKGIMGISKDGIKFVGWIDSQTETLTSFYPVKDWPEKLLEGVE